ncbi:MAG: AAA family ATPase [Acidimicrobiales bacterium]
MSLHVGGVTLAKRVRHSARGVGAKKIAGHVLSAMRAAQASTRCGTDPEVRTNVVVNAFAGDGRDLRLVGSGLVSNRGWQWWTELASGEAKSTPDNLELALMASARTMDPRATVEAIQLSLTPPKSWSLYAASGLSECRAVRTALDAGVTEVIRVLEAQACIRVWSPGPDGTPVALRVRGVTLAGFAALHSASGAGDPHLHAHVVLCAADGVTNKVIDTLELVNASGRLALASGWHAAAGVLEGCGLVVGADGELVGYDREAIEEASVAGNTVEAIRTLLAKVGWVLDHEAAWRIWRSAAGAGALRPDMLAKAPAEARGEVAALIASALARAGGLGEEIEHRIDAELAASPGQVLEGWARHFGGAGGASLAERAKRCRSLSKRAVAPEDRAADAALTRIGELVRVPAAAHARAMAATAVGYERADQLIDELVGAGQLIRTTAPGRGGEVIVVPDQVIEELELVRRAAAVAGAGRLRGVGGPAGSGKTTGIGASLAGRAVWACARNVLASRRLADALGAHALGFIRARSLAGLAQAVRAGRGPKPGTVVVVDEAGLVDLADAERLISLGEAGVEVILLGDDRQGQPIDGRGAWRLLSKAALDAGAYVDTGASRRCEGWIDEHDHLRAALGDAASAKALAEAVATDGRLIEVEGSKLGACLSALVAARGEQDLVVLARTNATAAAVAAALARPPTPIRPGSTVPTRSGERAWVGDRLRARQNHWGADTLVVANGEVGTIVGVTKRHARITLEAGATINVLRAELARSWSLAGAVTGDAAQGMTGGRAVVILDGSEGASWTYAAATRGTLPPIYVMSRAEPPEHHGGAQPDGPSATELLADAMSRDDRATPRIESVAIGIDWDRYNRVAYSGPAGVPRIVADLAGRLRGLPPAQAGVAVLGATMAGAPERHRRALLGAALRDGASPVVVAQVAEVFGLAVPHPAPGPGSPRAESRAPGLSHAPEVMAR